MSWRLFNRYSVAAISSLGGVSLYYFVSGNKDPRFTVENSWTTNFKPSVDWDSNWDHRACTSLLKPLPKDSSPEKENTYNEKVEKYKSKATRHIIMIRHGQYNLNGATDSERFLTELGRHQAKLTGQRLTELEIPIDKFVISTMTRAQETGKIILDQLPQRGKIDVEHDSLIEEGAPIPPEPKVGHWRPEPAVRHLKFHKLRKRIFFPSYCSSFSRMEVESKLVRTERCLLLQRFQINLNLRFSCSLPSC